MSSAALAFVIAWVAVPPLSARCGGKETVALLEKGMRLIDETKSDAGIEVLSKAIPDSCNEPMAFSVRALSYLGIHDYLRIQKTVDALLLADFQRVLTLDPSDIFAREWAARLLRGQGKHLEAANEWRIALHPRKKFEDPDEDPRRNPDTWAECALEYEEGGDVDGAIAILKEYFASFESKITKGRRESEPWPHRVMASLLLKKGSAKEALVHAQRAVRSKHAAEPDRMVHIQALEAVGRRAEALVAAEKLAREDEPSAELDETIARLKRPPADAAPASPARRKSSQK